MSPFGGSDNIFVFAVSVVAGIRVLGNKLHLSYSGSSVRSGVDPNCGSQHVAAASLQSTADRNAFLSSFCAQLLEIEEKLNERIGIASTRHSRTVWQLLEHLERMLKLQDTVHPSKQPDPTLEQRYPILWSLYAANQHDRITKGLKNFSRLNSIIHSRFLKSLKTFNKISPSSSTLENNRPEIGTPNDDQVYIKALHSAIKGTYCNSPSCSGYTSKGHHGGSTTVFKPAKLRHAARLRLQAQRATPTSNTVNFDMLFKKPGSGLGWQDIQLMVHRRTRTRWKCDDVTERKEDLKWFTNERFCSFLRDEEEKRLLIAVKKKNASYCFIYPPTIVDKDPQNASSGNSVSLAAILDEHTMTWQMKIVLAVILVSSAWQFYDSPWMKAWWDKHNIHFIDHEGFYANHPYLVADIDETPITHELENQSALPPKIFALAIMLLEIGLGIPFEKWPSPQHPTSSIAQTGGEDNPHYLYKLALRVALSEKPTSNCPIMSTECYLPYRKAIQTCLSLAKFNSDNEDDHRQILYEEVVLPLEACLIGSWGPADAILLDPMPRTISQPQIRRPHWFWITAQNDEHLRQGILCDKTRSRC